MNPPEKMIGETLADTMLKDGKTWLKIVKADGYPIYLHQMRESEGPVAGVHPAEDILVEVYITPHLPDEVFPDLAGVWVALEECDKLQVDK